MLSPRPVAQIKAKAAMHALHAFVIGILIVGCGSSVVANAAINNFTMSGMQDYRPSGLAFNVDGTMLGCKLELTAPIGEGWFKSLSIAADGTMDSVMGGIFDGITINLAYDNTTRVWDGDGTNPFGPHPGRYTYNLTAHPVETCSGRGTCIRESKAAEPACVCLTGHAGNECEDQIFSDAVVIPVLAEPNDAQPTAPVGAYQGFRAAAFAMQTIPGAGGPYKSANLQLAPGIHHVAYNETFFVYNPNDAPALLAASPQALKVEPMPGMAAGADDVIIECDGHSRDYALFTTYKHLHLENITIKNCYFPSGPGGVARSMSVDTEIVLSGVTITNTTSRYAGAIYAADSKKLEVFDSVLARNTAMDPQVGIGGAVYSVGSKTEVRGTRFIGNTAGFNAGGMYLISTATAKSTDAIIENCLFENNTATNQGAGILIQDVRTTIRNTRFRKNSIEMVPGRPRAGTTGTLRLTEELGGSGAGLMLAESLFTLDNVTFEENRADRLGGGLLVLNEATVFMSNSVFRGNNALIGGGMNVAISSVRLRNVSFEKNTADIDGGAAAVSLGYLDVVEATSFNENSAHEGGGALSVDGSTLEAASGTLALTGNTALNGGGIMSRNSNLMIPGAQMRSNAASGDGGAINLAEKGELNATDVICGSNEALNGYGGCLQVGTSQGVTVLEGTQFVNNSAVYGGGAALSISSIAGATIADLSLRSNKATVAGGGIFLAAQTTVDIHDFACVNCVYAQNSAGYGEDVATHPVRIASVGALSVGGGIAQKHAVPIVPAPRIAVVDAFEQVVRTDVDTRVFASLDGVSVPAATTIYPFSNLRLVSDAEAMAVSRLVGETRELSVNGISTFDLLGIDGYYDGVYTLSFRANINNPFMKASGGNLVATTAPERVYFSRKQAAVSFETVDSVLVLGAAFFIIFFISLHFFFRGRSVGGSGAGNSSNWIATNLNFSSRTLPMALVMGVYALYTFLVISFLPALSDHYKIEHDESLLLKLCIEGFMLSLLGALGVALMTITRMSNKLKSCLVVHSKDDEEIGKEVRHDIIRHSSNIFTVECCSCYDQQHVEQTLDALMETEIVVFIMSQKSIHDVLVAQVLYSAYDVGCRFVTVLNEKDKRTEKLIWQKTKGSLKMMMAGKARVSLNDKDWLPTLSKRLIDDDSASAQSRAASIAYRGAGAWNSTALSALSMVMNFASKINSEVVASVSKRWTVICSSFDFGCFCWLLTVYGTFIAMPRWHEFVDTSLNAMLIISTLATATGMVVVVPSTLQYFYSYRAVTFRNDIRNMYMRRMVLHSLTTCLFGVATAFILIDGDAWTTMGLRGVVAVSVILFALTCFAHACFSYIWICAYFSDSDSQSRKARRKQHRVEPTPPGRDSVASMTISPRSSAMTASPRSSTISDSSRLSNRLSIVSATSSQAPGQEPQFDSLTTPSSTRKDSIASRTSSHDMRVSDRFLAGADASPGVKNAVPEELLDHISSAKKSAASAEEFERRNSYNAFRSGDALPGAAAGEKGSTNERNGVPPSASDIASPLGPRLSLTPAAADAMGLGEGKTYDVFLSYKHVDMDVALTVCKLLQEEGYSVWIDTMIEPGENWREQVASSLERSKVVLFFATDLSIASQFCQEEILYSREMKKTILPLTLDAACFEEMKRYKLLHSILSPIQFIDFRTVDEGMAVLLLRLGKILRDKEHTKKAAASSSS